MDESEREEGFTIRDRRRFTSEGETKGSSEAASGQPEPEPAAERFAAEHAEPEATQAEPEPEGQPRPEELPPLDFAGFVIGLANSALAQLGFIPIPGRDKPMKDLQAARQTIDLIALLQEKTKGNLTAEEEKLISESLYSLRMAFVEASKK